MLNENTKNLIDIYLIYSNKTGLTVEEFLMFREQVVKESLQGVKNVNKPSITPATDSKSFISEDLIKSPSTINTNKENVEIKKNLVNDTEKDNKDNSFSNENFLSQMKSIED